MNLKPPSFLHYDAEKPFWIIYQSSYLYLRCWMVPRHLKFPLTMMASRVQRASHSSILGGRGGGHLVLQLFHVYEQCIIIYRALWYNYTNAILVTIPSLAEELTQLP